MGRDGFGCRRCVPMKPELQRMQFPIQVIQLVWEIEKMSNEMLPRAPVPAKQKRQGPWDPSDDVLPGEDAAAYEQLRRDLYRQYQCMTTVEAWHVDSLAHHQWNQARYRRWREVYQSRADAILRDGLPGKTRKQAETAAKRWERCVKDCLKMEGMMERMMASDRREILALQKMRRENLLEGANDAVLRYQQEDQPYLWPANHAPINENGNSDKRKANAEWHKQMQRLVPTEGHG